MSSAKLSTSERLIDTFSGGQRDVLERIAGGAPFAEVLEGIVRLVEQQADGMACSILLLDAEKRRVHHGASPSLPEAYSRAIDGLAVGPQTGSCGTAVYRRERVIVEDIATDPLWADFNELALIHGLRACWSSPIFSPTREVLGTFAMYYRAPRGPSPEEIAWVDAATHLAAVALCREASEAALRRSEAEFRVIFESAAMGVALVGSDGAVQKANPALEQLLGYTTAELVGKTIPQLTHPDDLDLGLFHELIAGTRDTYRYEKRYLRKDGRVVWVRVTASAVRENDGRFRFAIGIIEDVTERHRAEEERTRLEHQLRQSQKMQSLGTLAGGIAHDFNNILTAIGGNTQLAVADLPPDHPALLSLAEIERASDRAAGLVRQILSFSRPQEANRKVVRLHTVVEEALRLLRASLPATIAIRTEFADETPDVAADSTQLHQVVMNLGANAAHAMGDRGGRLEFYLAPLIVEAANAAAFPALRDGCYAQLTVRDNGCGMDPSTLDRVFEPFFTTKPPGQGTGLGLSMVHGIIKGHSGVITVESEPERGTAFRIYFPAVESPATETTIAPSATLRGHGEHVLYVDDEETLVLLARRGLPRLGYRITAFTDARAALQHFRGHPADFDVVVTDLSMPGLSGLDLATEILRLRRDLPIILTTGYLRPQDATHAQALGLHDILPKPASHDTLAHALQRALQRR